MRGLYEIGLTGEIRCMRCTVLSLYSVRAYEVVKVNTEIVCGPWV